MNAANHRSADGRDDVLHRNSPEGAGAALGREPFHYVRIEKAHDVRSLRLCEYCQGLGHNHSMICTMRGRTAPHWHGRCYIKEFGMAPFLALPHAQTDKMTLGDIEGEAIHALLSTRLGDRKGS